MLSLISFVCCKIHWLCSSKNSQWRDELAQSVAWRCQNCLLRVSFEPFSMHCSAFHLTPSSVSLLTLLEACSTTHERFPRKKLFGCRWTLLLIFRHFLEVLRGSTLKTLKWINFLWTWMMLVNLSHILWRLNTFHMLPISQPKLNTTVTNYLKNFISPWGMKRLVKYSLIRRSITLPLRRTQTAVNKCFTINGLFVFCEMCRHVWTILISMHYSIATYELKWREHVLPVRRQVTVGKFNI